MNNLSSGKELLWIASIFLVFAINACHQEEFSNDPGLMLKPELDTLTFDTVFTSIGSATRYFKLYNPNDEFVRIQSIYIPSLENSEFRLNVDGISSQKHEFIDIAPHDSIYIFCDVKVNPDDPVTISPFIKQDSIRIEYNGNVKIIQLIAWGQNANYVPQKSNKGQVSVIDLQGNTLVWNDPKPYVVYGIVVFENGVLQINAGTKIHVWGGLAKAKDADGNVFFYNDGRIIIGPTARIEVRGTKEQPVQFQGVRLESWFKDTPGQWGGIFINPGSTDNSFDFAEIKNNLIGIYLDSLASLKITNSRIFNNSQYGILSSTGILDIQNCLFYNQGQSGLFATIGGVINCAYTTFANLGNSEPALYLSNEQCIDFPFCQVVYKHPLVANFTNCIITGSDQDELWLVDNGQISFQAFFKNCLYRIKELLVPFPDFENKFTQNCILHNSLQKLFADPAMDDFHLDTLSVAEQKAVPLPNLLLDLDCKIRDAQLPDLGCFEYQY
ncbi:MAG: right-handed parallel beta-helix repeat-containing protein [Saprospiraceae bacterium]|nr:right-handed parallel beta-helix repeat-containing protein [Saprospiraceae bacterium]